MKIKTIQHHYVDAPAEENIVLFLLMNGWEKMGAMPKYVKNCEIVNVKFPQALIEIVARVEITDSHEIVRRINEINKKPVAHFVAVKNGDQFHYYEKTEFEARTRVFSELGSCSDFYQVKDEP